jgi:hypothetical protein
MQIIQVVGEHPKYSFFKDEIVVVLADNQDRFWIAQVTDTDNEKIEISLRYFHFTRNGNDDKRYKLHDSTGNCGISDVLCSFFSKEKIFTKNRKIRKVSLTKIKKAYHIYMGKKLQ